jgi:hypothetical protein
MQLNQTDEINCRRSLSNRLDTCIATYFPEFTRSFPEPLQPEPVLQPRGSISLKVLINGSGSFSAPSFMQQ